MTPGLIYGRLCIMAKFMTFTEAEAKALSKECPTKLIEIVRTYFGRTGKSSARRAVRAPQFLLDHGDGEVSVAELTERPKCPTKNATKIATVATNGTRAKRR